MATTTVSSADHSAAHSKGSLGTYVRYNFGRWLLLLGLFVLSVIMVAPIVWTISTSLRTPAQSFSLPPKWLPTDWAWENYTEVFDQIPFFREILNSFIVTVGTVVGQLVTASLAGYAFARLDFPGKTVLFWLVMATLMIPLQATIIPVFVLISRLGLSDTLASLILPALPTAFGTFLLRQYFMQIPKDFEEVALIDGANQFYIFRESICRWSRPAWRYWRCWPLTAPGTSSTGPWSSWSPTPTSPSRSGLNDLKGYMMTGSISVVLAGVVLSLIPVVIVYLFGQRYLMEGIMMGGLKG